jgi:hypothetical protein
LSAGQSTTAANSLRREGAAQVDGQEVIPLRRFAVHCRLDDVDAGVTDDRVSRVVKCYPHHVRGAKSGWYWPGEDFMLKTRITEQYGLKVTFINAGMAFIATAPLVRAVCCAGGMGMLGSAAIPPDLLQAAIRDIKAVDPASYASLCPPTDM